MPAGASLSTSSAPGLPYDQYYVTLRRLLLPQAPGKHVLYKVMYNIFDCRTYTTGSSKLGSGTILHYMRTHFHHKFKCTSGLLGWWGGAIMCIRTNSTPM